MKPTLPNYLHPLESFTGKFPLEAMRAAVDRREESLPYLLEALEHAAESGSPEPDGMLYLYALYLLAQFRETSALEGAARLARRHDADALLDDTLTEGLSAILASLYGGDSNPIASVIEDEAADEFARGAAVQALATLVVHGLMERGVLSGTFGELLENRLERRPSHVWNSIVDACAALGMTEHLEAIRRAYLDGLADPMSESLESIEERIPRPLPKDELLKDYPLMNDAIAEMEWWDIFDMNDKYDEEDGLPNNESNFEEDLPDQSSEPGPIRRSSEKLGRNDPCHCGSGKKYKKCCLAKDEAAAREAMADVAAARARLPQDSPDPQEELPPPAPSESPVPEQPLSPEEQKAEALWTAFNAIEHPSTEQMDAHLQALLALGAEEDSWSEVFTDFARAGHEDLPGLFRRMAAAIPHTKEAGMSYFYWGAAETFARADQRDMLAEVAAACERLDAGNYNADALTHLEDYLLTAGLEDEALRLIERFLPILRDQTASGDLMPWAAPIAESRLFDLRLGAAIRADSAAGVAPENLAAALLDGLEEEFDANAAAIAAAAVIDGNAPTAWSREHFDLAASTSKESKVRAVDLALIGVAKEAWQIERISPGCVLVGLGVLLAGAGEPPRKSSGKKKKKQRNLLSFLAPSGIEKRVVAECRDLMRINVPKARLLLDAHDTLRRFAARHGLIPEAESAATKKELTRLRQAIQGDA